MFKLPGHNAWELIEKHNIDPDEHWLEELDSIVGNKGLFKLFYSEYNITNNNQTYRCDSFSDNVELINHFKKSFLDMESETEESNDELETSNITTKTKRHDETDERTSNMNKHLNIHESSTNEEGTMSRKTKVTSDTTEVKSEPDEEFNNTYDNQVIEEKIQRNTRSRKKKLTSDVFEVQSKADEGCNNKDENQLVQEKK
ncbi:hypothetical protein Tco_1077857 [Tanacetum coccineum]